MPRMFRPLLAVLCAVAALLLSQDRARAQADGTGGGGSARGPVLLELFTSQGCSACPPADRLLATLGERPDLLVLSFHVSYWDHMGWSDPFAIPASVRRQRGYARAMRSRSIYTPQIVVQGSAAAVGSDEARIERLIRDAAPSVALAIAREGQGGERLSVTVPEVRDVSVPLELWAVLYVGSDERFVPNGENAGHLLRHVNVVRQAGIVAVLETTPAVVRIDRPEGVAADGVAMILQGRNLGPVVGTGRLALR
jgi:hypothetical protein